MLKIQTAVLLVILAVASTLVLPVAAASLNPNKLYGAPTFVLNLLGKKDGWSGGGSYDNPDRHTMFVPDTTTDPSAGNVDYACRALKWLRYRQF